MGEGEKDDYRWKEGRKAGESKGDMQVVCCVERCCVAVLLRWCVALGDVGK